MMLYSCDQGHTLVDNYDEIYLDTERELPSEVCDPTDTDINAWSGFLSDMWDSDSTYSRPNILCWGYIPKWTFGPVITGSSFLCSL